MKIIDSLITHSSPLLSQWGHLIIFLGALLETIPLLGLFIPGGLIIIVGGFFAKAGLMNIWLIISIAIFGAITGDIIAYMLGKKYGYSLLIKHGKKLYFKIEQYKKTKQLMNEHLGKTLIIGRFYWLTRGFAPFVAGSTKIKFSRFIIYDGIGSILWGASFALTGYVFGASYEIAAEYIGEFALIALVIGICIIGIYKFINRRTHIFSRKHLYFLLANVFSLYVFAKLIEDVLKNELVSQTDVWISAKVMLFWNPALNSAMIIITRIANPFFLFLMSLGLFFFLLYKKKWYNAALLTTSLLGGFLLESIAKILIQRPRPANSLIEVFGYSFPSGHATMSIIFFGMLIYSFKDDIKNAYAKYAFIFSCTIIFLLVGFSRVYLNVHWLSDVIAGFALGLFWITLLILTFRLIITFSHESILKAKAKLDNYFS